MGGRGRRDTCLVDKGQFMSKGLELRIVLDVLIMSVVGILGIYFVLLEFRPGFLERAFLRQWFREGEGGYA